MGFDLYIRSDEAHHQRGDRQQLLAVFERFGLRPSGEMRWSSTRDNESMDVYLSTLSDGDAVAGDGDTFHEIQCHPRPPTLHNYTIVLGLAAKLGWEVYDPQKGQLIRGALQMQPSLPSFTAAQHAHHSLRAPEDWQGKGQDIIALDDERLLIVRKDDREELLELRTGEALTVDAHLTNVSHSLAARGRRLLAGAERDPVSSESKALLILDSETLEQQASLPLHPQGVWLPDWDDAFLALATANNGDRRLLIVDASTSKTYPLAHDEITGTLYSYDTSHLGVSGDGEHALLMTQTCLHVFSLSSGALRARYPVRFSAAYAMAASPCGRFVAMGGLSNEESLVVLEISSGLPVLRLSGALLGYSAVRALVFHPSGWLAVGFAQGSAMALGMDGSLRRFTLADAGLAALCFQRGALLGVGTTPGVSCVTLLPDEQAAALPVAYDSPEARKRQIEAWSHGDEPLRLIKGLDAPFTLDVEVDLERLTDVSNDDLLRAVTCGTGSDSNWTCALALARRRHTPPVFVHALARFVTRGLADSSLARLREILSTLPPETHAQILLQAGPPNWQRFTVRQTDEALDALLATIRALPRGAFTQLKKSGGKFFELYNGYGAKGFETCAIEAVVAYGASAVPKLDAILATKDKFAYRALLEKARARLV